jgi:hypothetical protein
VTKNRAQKKKSAIRTLHDIKREKAKAQERLAYSESLIKEDWQELQDQVRPSALINITDRLLPYLGNILPLGRIVSGITNRLFKKGEEPDTTEKTQDNSSKQKGGWMSGWYRYVLPFIGGAVAMASIFSRKSSS